MDFIIGGNTGNPKLSGQFYSFRQFLNLNFKTAS